MGKNSYDFAKAKKLIYVDKYDVDSVNIKSERSSVDDEFITNAEIVFCNNGKTEIIKSSENDFIQLAFSLKNTVHNGKSKIIEIKDTKKYYENIENFKLESKEPLKEAINKLSRGESKLPLDFSFQDAIDDITRDNFKTKNVKNLLENYYEAMGLEILKLKEMNSNLEKMKNKTVDADKFIKQFNTAGKIYQDHLFQLPEIESLKAYKKFSKVDLDLISKSILLQHKTIISKWGALTQNGRIGVEGTIAAKELVDNYRDFYEISKKMLKHLASIIKSTKNITLNSENDIWQTLDQEGYGELVKPIDSRLRNCGTHWDIDYSDKGKVKLLDTRSGKGKLIGEMTYAELIDNTHAVRDLASSLFVSIVMVEELLYFRAMDSPEMKFKLVENC